MRLLSSLVLGLSIAPTVALGAGGSMGVAGGVSSADAWLGLLSLDGLAALLTLTALEIVLGIDNIVFLSILTASLPEAQRPRARQLGLLLAMVSRILLLLAVGWLMRLTTDLFQLPLINGDSGISGKDIILLVGGGFLLAKATLEIHKKVEGHADAVSAPRAGEKLPAVLAQIVLVDIVFSLDSVITAVGMTLNVPVMILAVITSVIIMMFAAGPIARFVERHPAVKILALAFLVLIGVLLMAEGLGQHLSKGYVYFAMAFALVVEMLQLRMQKKAETTVSLGAN